MYLRCNKCDFNLLLSNNLLFDDSVHEQMLLFWLILFFTNNFISPYQQFDGMIKNILKIKYVNQRNE